jgi:FtsP/CotA-like multicopper oxidase with cupredoxin domain
MRSTLHGAILRAAALAGVGMLLAAGVSSAATVEVYLQTQSFSKPLPGGANVPMWGFASCDSTFTTCGAPSAPGPRIDAVPGDTLNINVQNTLGTPVSILIPGQAGGGDPAIVGGRARSLTKETASGATETYSWTSVRAGTFLYESGTHQPIQVPMGLYGALVVGPGSGACTAPMVAAYDTPASCYDADGLLFFSEIDPVQNAAVAALLAPIDPADYPSAVDYTPKYFLINGEPYDKTAPPATITAGAPGNNVLLRFLNAGLQSHAPAIIGLTMGQVAEDGNPYPGSTRQQSSTLLAAGKSLDVLVAMPAGDATYPLFDRFLDLTNDNQPDGGMLAYLIVGAGSGTPPPASIQAVDDTYDVMEDTPLVGATSVLVNDIGLAGATVTVTGLPAHGTVLMNPDGTFTYSTAPNFSGADSFIYSASFGGMDYPATVTLNVSFVNDAPVAADDAYVNGIGAGISVSAPGVLGNDSDPDGDTMTAVLDAPVAGVTLNPDGSFTYDGSGGSTFFTYQAVDENGAPSAAPATVTLNINPVANIALDVHDPSGAPVASYRWIVQEDATYNIDPDAPVANSATLSTNFHKSYMPVVAQGCVGAECLQLNPGVPLAASIPIAPFDMVALDPARRYYVSVLPNDAYPDGTGHSIGGAQIPAGTNGSTISVIVNNQPIPTAQLSVIAFEDNNPTNGVPDPGEPGLGGFEIILEDAGGRYGISGGTMSQDAFGNPLKNSLLGTPGCPGAAPVGVILTCPDGTALIRDLAPAKIGVVVVPAAGTGTWTQTSTIEGTKLQDNWVKAGEPPFLVEFGAPGFHAFLGFVNPEHTTVPPGPPGLNSNTITGSVTMVHTARPPDQTAFDSGSYDALGHTRAWVGLNSDAGGGPNIATVHADPDGSFTITGIPDGTYQLAIWDDYLDQIIAYQTVTVSGPNATVDVGHVPVNTWFGRHEHNVFLDDGCAELGGGGIAGDGIRQPCERGLPDQNVNLRFRDGTVEQSFPTDTEGFVPFDQVFPYGAWQIAEIDFLRFKPTGVTVTVDGGGDISGGPYPGLLNPQVQADGALFRSETGPVLLEGFQSQPGNTSLFDWGKKPYAPGENGGIAGIVFYSSTRGENDPRLTVGDPWEPGIPGVKVRLYREVAKADGTKALSLVDEVMTDSWDAATPTDCLGEPPSPNPFTDTTLLEPTPRQTENTPTRCFDGIRNFEQIRPGVFDGGYAFSDIPPGTYVVEVVPPPGYELYKEEDKNVDFGDTFETIAPAALMLPGGASLAIVPDQAMVMAVMAVEPGLLQPPCVGPLHEVPAQLSLFPGVDTYAPFAGEMRPLCNRKRVILSDQSQAAADFHLFTSTPVAGQGFGLTTDDVAIETNPASPSYGDKWGPAFMPISMRDFLGHEVYRGYSDAFGRYNALLPSTFSANVPVPSGYSPAMHQVCLNDPGPLPDGTLDPRRNPNYGIFCYTLMYMPGTTTYLDTPVLPLAAFAAGFNSVDCAFPDGTPVVKSVGSETENGTLVAPGGTLTILSQGPTVVPNPAYEGPTAPAMAPWNEPTITRDYGFGASQGSGSVTLVNAAGTATALTGIGWGDGQITGTVPNGTPIGDYQLVVTRDNGTSTVNSVTVTVDGGLTPVRVGPGRTHTTIQAAIDAANPGDLILVDPGVYEELVVMWKPVRLQGSGEATLINAVKRPPEKLQAWRTTVKNLLDAGTVDLLPGQPGPDFNLVAGGLFGTELGAGITVLAKNDTSFVDNPSRIDGFTITGADGGGGIFVNGYAHNLVISNNDVNGNSGVVHGGIRIGHVALAPAGDGPFGYNRNLKIHHNAIRLNGSQSDTGAGGGLALCTGTDNYTVSRNFVCGNFTLGEGAGIAHFGLSTPGLIEFNQILFNQTFNQGLNQSGGGLLIAGEPPAAGAALTLGAGNVTADANLIQGNHAGSGHGGGVRTQSVNGRDVELSPNQPNGWWRVRMTNNMVVNNVAGWSGGGISLNDTVNASIVLNTVAHNDSTATVGAVIDATGNSTRQPAGISSERNSLGLDAVIPGNQASRRNFSNAELTHNIVWENRAFTYDITTGTPRLLPVLNQASVGDCPGGADFFDLGVLDPAFSLSPVRSILTSTAGYPGNNISANPQLLSAYCNGARSLRVPGGGTTMSITQEAAEGGNSIDVRFGPLTPMGDYHIASASPAVNFQPTGPSTGVTHDFDNQIRPQGPRVDLGADEVPAGTVTFTSASFGTLTGGTLAFGTQPNGNYSSTVTLTIGGAPVVFGTLTVTNTSGTAFSKGADTCQGQTILAGGTCTVTINFNGNGNNSKSGTLTVNDNGNGSPQLLALTGQ